MATADCCCGAYYSRSCPIPLHREIADSPEENQLRAFEANLRRRGQLPIPQRQHRMLASSPGAVAHCPIPEDEEDE